MNQKNIDVINICLDMMETFGNEKSKADIKEAKVAFRGMAEKATPKKPKYEDICQYKYGLLTAICPACKSIVESPLMNDDYCRDCGQAIDWEGK